MPNTSNLFRKSVLIAAPLALLTLAGCASTPFRAEVSRFQQLPDTQGQSYTVTAADPKDVGGIEFDQYASLVATKMNQLGYVPAADPKTADLNISLDYGVDQGKERRIVQRDPFYDPFWGYGRVGFGRGGFYRPYRFHGYHGRFVHGFYDPFLFGGSGFGGRYDVDSFTVYTGDIDLDIKRNSDGKSLFEGKAEAKSRSNRLSYLVPNLIEAMFTGFPGNSGEVVRISVAPEPKSKK